ncbi:SLC13 family permease [candidate division KSB1 bacterium]
MEKIAVSVLFVLTYIGIILNKRHRALVIWAGIAVLLIAFPSNFIKIFGFINWNVLGIFAGTLILADFFIYSQVPAYLSNIIINRSKNVAFAIIGVCALSSVLSIFIDNVATLLIIAPIAIAFSKKLKLNPTYFIIGVAICSNLQGAAILVGDAPSMILAAHEKLTFNDFFFIDGKPSVFFAIEIGAIVSMFVIYGFFRKHKETVSRLAQSEVVSWTPTVLILVMIFALIIAAFIDKDFIWLSGTICVVLALISLVWGNSVNREETKKILKRFDWDTTLFLAGIFVMVGFLETYNIIESIKNGIVYFTGTDVFLTYTFIVWVSIIFSAFIDNVPYITAMLPVTSGMALDLGISPFLFSFGLLIGSCLGGNITPIGAAANVVSVGILKKEGYVTSFWTFIKLGLPFTIAATIAGYIFNWCIWR